MENWLRAMSDYLRSGWGIAARAGIPFAKLYLYLWWYGLDPHIQSGFRDPAHQQDLRDRWDRGDRSGLAVRPALTSSHTQGIAIDISTTDAAMAANIARQLGIRAGYNFAKPDPVHFDLVGIG